MSDKTFKIKNSPYPGRVIVLGKDNTGRHVVILYAVTGRSSSSQARRIEYFQNQAFVKPANTGKLKSGNKDLLIYPAIRIEKGIAVSNGRHTDVIHKNMVHSSTPVQVLSSALKSWDYEPDAPNYTPRISGCILSSEKAALSIIKRSVEGGCLKNFYEFPLVPGRGKMLSTYEGKNTEPLPSFKGEPLELEIPFATAEKTAQYFYDSMKPDSEQPDFRVALVCVFSEKSNFQKSTISIINRNERRES